MGMSPQEVEPLFRTRGRSNTNSFANFPWRRGRHDPPPTNLPAAPEPTLSVDELIAALSPPAVPSLATLRALSAALANASNVKLFSLAPILASLCTADAPASLRAAGYDLLTAFLERTPAPPLPASDRIALFSLFTASGQNAWHPDVWEARFRAFTAFTREGAEIAGIEPQMLEMLQTWIDAAFSGLLTSSREVLISSSGTSTSSERAERERCVDVLGSFLTVTTSRLETLARLGEPTIAKVLDFLGGLVERALAQPTDPPYSAFGSPDILQGPHTSIPPTPTRASQSHRRHSLFHIHPPFVPRRPISPRTRTSPPRRHRRRPLPGPSRRPGAISQSDASQNHHSDAVPLSGFLRKPTTPTLPELERPIRRSIPSRTPHRQSPRSDPQRAIHRELLHHPPATPTAPDRRWTRRMARGRTDCHGRVPDAAHVRAPRVMHPTREIIHLAHECRFVRT